MKKFQLLNQIILLIAVLLSTNNAMAQCAITSQPTNNCTSGDVINTFSLNSIASTGSGNSCTNGYVSFTQTFTLTIGSTYPWTATVGGGTYSQGVAIWIDLNNNSMYDNAEMLVSSSPTTAHTSNITIPGTATAATVRMRVRCAYNYSILNSDACTNSIGSYGETEDYYVTLVSPCQGPAITSQPTAQNFCPSGTANFSAAAPTAATYKWQVSTAGASGPFTDLTNNTIYNNTSTNSLALSNIPPSYGGYQYRLKATSGCGTPTYSNPAALTMFAPVAVSSQTPSVLICEDASTSMNVTVSNTASGYQWQYGTLTNGYKNVPAQFPFSGTTAAQLNIASVDDSLNGVSFRCIVGGPCSADTSADIPMDVILGPFIAEDPNDDTTAPYSPADFSIAASGSQYILYWQASADNGITFVNINENSLYKNTTGSTLYITSATPAQTGMKFRCILKSTNPACGLLRDTSDAGTLYVGNFGTNVAEANKTAIDITLYPNPVTGNELHINTGNLPVDEIRIKIIDKLGRVLYNTPTNMRGKKTITLPVSGLAAGVYNLQISDADNNVLSTAGFTKQ